VSLQPEPPRSAWNGLPGAPGRPLTDELCALLGVAPGSVWGDPPPSAPIMVAPLPPERHGAALLRPPDSGQLAAAAGWRFAAAPPPATPSAYLPAPGYFRGPPGTRLTSAQRAALGAAPGAVWDAPSPPVPNNPTAPPAADADAGNAAGRPEVDAILLAAVPGTPLTEAERALLGMGPGAVWGELEFADGSDDPPRPGAAEIQVRGGRNARGSAAA
jgi:hypothetical protein